MTPPGSSLEIPRPFADGPRPPSGGGGGWGKPLALGCGALALVALVLLGLLVMNADSLVQWGLDIVRDDLFAHLPAGMPEPERERLEAAFAAAEAAVVEGETEPAALQRLQRELMELSRTPPEERSREQLLELAEALEAVAGGGGDGGP
mgnify:CR=1 FL=1